MRLVLDTNVWLDWLIFDDPAILSLRAAKEAGAIEIVTDTPCRDELVRVLAYPKFALDDQSQRQLLAQADQNSICLDDLSYPAANALPACDDPDDVKFQSLAYASHADWLISKDNALLAKQRKRKFVPVAYRVVTPKQWALLQADNTTSID
jgi:putative PIN family toxin of toxin-antitoxin system